MQNDPDKPARDVQPRQPGKINPDDPASAEPGNVSLEDIPVALKPGWGPASWFRLALVVLALVIARLALARWLDA